MAERVAARPAGPRCRAEFVSDSKVGNVAITLRVMSPFRGELIVAQLVMLKDLFEIRMPLGMIAKTGSNVIATFENRLRVVRPSAILCKS